MRRALGVALVLLAVALLVVAWRLRTPPASTADARPNVVLVIGCTVRKDQLTPYGGPDGLTPFLARAAAQGALFTDGIVAAPWTKPGTTSVVTGYHAVSIGMVEPGMRSNSRRLSPRVTTLAEHFHGAGYATHGATANPNANALFGFDQGFDDYLEGSELWRDAGVVKTPGEHLADLLVDTVDGGPFYLQILLVDAHEPYDTPLDEARALISGDEPERLGRYRAALRRFDEAVEHLVKVLARRGYTEENTVFTVVSDHGEGLRHPRHHGRAHGVYTFSSTVDMPWITWGRGIPAGHVVQGLASQVDVAPTLLGLAGIEGYEGPGMDWSAQARGEVAATTRDKAYVDTWFARASRAAVYTDAVACHEAFQMGTAYPNRRVQLHTGCYDRIADPWSTTPLGPPPRDLVDDLAAWRQARWDEYQAWPDTANAEVNDELSKQLEALGYVQ